MDINLSGYNPIQLLPTTFLQKQVIGLISRCGGTTMACKLLGTILFFLSFVGCAATVEPYGNDTYVVFVDSYSKSEARTNAIHTANEYCAEKGKQMMPKSEHESNNYNPALGRRKTVKFVFRCLETGDKDLQRSD